MSFITDIISQLQNLGFSDVESLEDIPNITGEDWMSQIMETFDIEDEEFMPTTEEFPYGVSQRYLNPIYGKTYSPLFRAKGQSLMDDLSMSYQKHGRKAFGGFAGSRQEDIFKRKAKDVYGAGMAPLIAEQSTSQNQALQALQDRINQMQQVGFDISGSGTSLV